MILRYRLDNKVVRCPMEYVWREPVPPPLAITMRYLDPDRLYEWSEYPRFTKIVDRMPEHMEFCRVEARLSGQDEQGRRTFTVWFMPNKYTLAKEPRKIAEIQFCGAMPPGDFEIEAVMQRVGKQHFPYRDDAPNEAADKEREAHAARPDTRRQAPGRDEGRAEQEGGEG